MGNRVDYQAQGKPNSADQCCQSGFAYFFCRIPAATYRYLTEMDTDPIYFCGLFVLSELTSRKLLTDTTSDSTTKIRRQHQHQWCTTKIPLSFELIQQWKAGSCFRRSAGSTLYRYNTKKIQKKKIWESMLKLSDTNAGVKCQKIHWTVDRL